MTDDKDTFESASDSQSDGVNSSRDGRTAQRDASGRFLRGNTASLVHGGRSELLPRRLADEAMAEKEQAVLADLGGNVSTIAAGAVHRYVAAEALLAWMEARLIDEGVLTRKGHQKALHKAYLAQLDRVVRLAQLIGLEKKAKGVSLVEHMRAKGYDK